MFLSAEHVLETENDESQTQRLHCSEVCAQLVVGRVCKIRQFHVRHEGLPHVPVLDLGVSNLLVGRRGEEFCEEVVDRFA